MATKTETAPPWIWGAVLMCAGAAVMVASEFSVGVFAFRTADTSVMLGGIPVDALNKVAIGSLAGVLAFGGMAVWSWLATHDRKPLQRQARIALAVTLCASAFAVFNLASAFGYYRRTAEAPKVAASAEYAQALETYRAASGRLSGEIRDTDGAGFSVSLGEEEAHTLKRQAAAALAVVKRGEAPTGAELPGLFDVLRAIIAHLLGVAPAAAFRLPAARKTPKRGKRAKSATGKPQLKAVS